MVLDPKGSEDAWLTLHPRFKFQVEGSPVLNRDVLQMHSSRRQLSLHYGDRRRRRRRRQRRPLAAAAADGARRAAPSAAAASAASLEINAAAEAGALQLLILTSQADQPAVDDDENNLLSAKPKVSVAVPLRCGDVVSLYHSQAEANLVSAWELHAKDEAPRDDTVTLLHSQTPEWVGANALWQIQSPVGLNDGSVLRPRLPPPAYRRASTSASPILRTSSIAVEDSVSNERVLEPAEALARTVLEGNERVEELLAKMSEGEGGPQ